MKKKMIIRIIVCFLAIMNLMVCGTEVAAKRQQVKGNNAMSKYLDNQIKTSDVGQLIEVAKCKYATKKQLVEVAKRCANYDMYDDKKEATELAQALVKNKKSTGKVLEELANSYFLEVVSIGHQWFDKKAKRDEKIQYLDRQIKTSDVDQLIEVAKCKYATKKQLVEVAKRCANYDMYDDKKEVIELAQALVKNKKSTGKVLEELANSYFPEVVSIGHKGLEKKIKKAKNKR